MPRSKDPDRPRHSTAALISKWRRRTEVYEQTAAEREAEDREVGKEAAIVSATHTWRALAAETGADHMMLWHLAERHGRTTAGDQSADTSASPEPGPEVAG